MNVEVRGLMKSYHQGTSMIPVLRDVSLNLKTGETVSIVGKSGSGKSTLLSLLAGLIKADEGTIRFDSKNLESLNEEQLTDFRANNLGIIYQQFHLLPHLTALENISLALEILGNPQALELAQEKINDVGLFSRKNHFPDQLSGGEQQRVAVARSMVISPKLLLADEPSGSLDEETGKTIMDLIFELVEKKSMAMILVTHNRELAKNCQKTYQLDIGVLKEHALKTSN